MLVYAPTREEAICKAKVLAMRILADRLEHGEELPEARGVFAITS